MPPKHVYSVRDACVGFVVTTFDRTVSQLAVNMPCMEMPAPPTLAYSVQNACTWSTDVISCVIYSISDPVVADVLLFARAGTPTIEVYLSWGGGGGVSYIYI